MNKSDVNTHKQYHYRFKAVSVDPGKSSLTFSLISPNLFSPYYFN